MADMTSEEKIFAVVGVGAVGYLIYTYFIEKKPDAKRPGPPIYAPPQQPPQQMQQPQQPPQQPQQPQQSPSQGPALISAIQAQAMLLAMSELWKNPAMNPKGVDGIMGGDTASALKSWQGAAELPKTGVLDAATAKNLLSIWVKFGAPLNALPPGPKSDRAFGVLTDLRKSMQGAAPAPAPASGAIAAIQAYLNRAGTKPQLAVNGVYDAPTTKAIKELQLAFGLPQTGLVDDATASMMNTTQVVSQPGNASTAVEAANSLWGSLVKNFNG